MKIGIMCSLDFANEVIDIKSKLEERGHEVSVPISIERILNGERTYEEIMNMKNSGSFIEYVQNDDLIRWNWDRMNSDDAILVVNFDKKGIQNYIGGNTFLEIGFAHILKMPIFLWNDIPDMLYSDEIKVMNPTILNQNVDLIPETTS